jgi:hypothetical protein
MIIQSSQILLSLVTQKDKYELITDYNLIIEIDNQTYDIWIPEGFIYNGANIPPFFWPMFYSPFAPDVMRAALVHDWLYSTHRVQKEPITRKIADSVFKELISVDGASIIKPRLMHWGLWICGGGNWKNNTDEDNHLTTLRNKKGAEAWKFGL